MGNSVTFLTWKLILQKNNLRNILLIIFGIFISILNEIKIYEKSLDPEFCEIILKKINSFNDSCTPTLEILDCG